MMVVIVIMMTMMPWMTDNDDGGKCDTHAGHARSSRAKEHEEKRKPSEDTG